MDRYDSLLLEACTTEWIPAARLVGAAMGRCDGHNLMSDLFFCSRMQRMIDARTMEAEGRRTRLRDYVVRLPMPMGGENLTAGRPTEQIGQSGLK